MISSLYIHIPFCLKKCDYCDFFSVPQSGKIPDAYVQALINEEKFYAEKYGIKKWKTVYLGGGTPGLLSAEQISFLFKNLSPRILSKTEAITEITEATEITMEMNPESVTREKLLAAEKGGITRLSLGIQSLNDKALKAVNRHCSSQKAKEALALIKAFWHGQLNLDSIAGLPEQTEQEFLASLKEIIAYNPDHISLYTLTVEEKTPLYKNIELGLVNYNPDAADEQWLKGRQLLEENNFHQYEVSNFSKPQKESRHNMTYWMQENYVGIGAGATGTIYAENSIRWTNTQNIEEYINFWQKNFTENNCIKYNSTKNKFSQELQNNLPEKNSPYKKTAASVLKNFPLQIEEIDLATKEFEFIMMGLRTTKGINSAEYKIRFSKVSPWNGNLSARLGTQKGPWKDFSAQKMTKEKSEKDGSTTYALNSSGLNFLNKFLVELL